MVSPASRPEPTIVGGTCTTTVSPAAAPSRTVAVSSPQRPSGAASRASSSVSPAGGGPLKSQGGSTLCTSACGKVTPGGCVVHGVKRGPDPGVVGPEVDQPPDGEGGTDEEEAEQQHARPEADLDAPVLVPV